MVIFPWDSNGLLLGFHNSQARASEHVHGKWDLLGIGLSHGLVFDFDDKPVAEWDFFMGFSMEYVHFIGFWGSTYQFFGSQVLFLTQTSP